MIQGTRNLPTFNVMPGAHVPQSSLFTVALTSFTWADRWLWVDRTQ